jgi:hypothetical protein
LRAGKVNGRLVLAHARGVQTTAEGKTLLSDLLAPIAARFGAVILDLQFSIEPIYERRTSPAQSWMGQNSSAQSLMARSSNARSKNSIWIGRNVAAPP